MPKVRVTFSGPLGAKVGVNSIDLELPDNQVTVGSLLERLGIMYPALRPVLPQEGPVVSDVGATVPGRVRVFLNGRGLQFQGGVGAILMEGDELALLLPIGGG